MLDARTTAAGTGSGPAGDPRSGPAGAAALGTAGLDAAGLDAAAGWALAAALSPRPVVRLADLDPAGRAVNGYRGAESPLSGPAPQRPYALYLADRAGGYRLLGFDLDASRGPVGEDLAELRALLTRAGLGRHLVCASGPGGGRHVWVALATPAPAPLVAAVARGLACRLPTLDVAPLTNPATGCLRPPGAPHRAGGRSQPVAGSAADLSAPRAGVAQVRALAALIDTGPAGTLTDAGRAVGRDTEGVVCLLGPRGPLPAGSAAALHAPLPAGADASAVLWTVALGAARARWHLADLAALADTAPGLEHARTARGGRRRVPRSPQEAAAVLRRQWARAVDHVAAAAPARAADPRLEARAAAAVAAVARVQARAEASPGRWARPGGPADRRVLDAVCHQLLAAVRLDVELDVRRLGEACGISRETARRALARLETDGWVEQAAPSAGPTAARWGLQRPTPRLSTSVADNGVSQGDPPPAGAWAARSAWRHALARRAADQAHDVFTPRPGLGHHAARVYAALGDQEQPTAGLADRLGYSPARLGRLLTRLEDAGLAQYGPGAAMVRRHTSPDLDRAARRLGVAGRLAARRHRHHVERAAWAWWCEELTWMHLPRSAKRRRTDPAPGQTVVPLPGLTTRQRHGPHPRRADGRADYAAALALLTAPEQAHRGRDAA